ncbi:class I SAM-dependent methyltransferase [Vibrio sp.]|uniref:class I SAM-dependent methyltransferase n=1 Tax=Vibrio sp. TaxID=678 RepID=UPI003D0DD9F8
MIPSASLIMPKTRTMFSKGARAVALRSLHLLRIGSLTIKESYHDENMEQFGSSDTGQLHAFIEVKHPDFYARLLKGGSIAAAEAYMDGWWDSPDLTAVMELMARNLSALDQLEAKSSVWTRSVNQLGHWLKRNTVGQAKENIEAHYDLGNTLYQTFLDKNMLYSSALYHSAEESLEQAQINKMDRLCQQLQLQPTDHVLEIGTGWGAMAIYMAQQYGCRVTTTTISEQQFAYTEALVKQLGLSDKITLLKKDYRQLTGQFDKLVSIEMIEAVGHAYLKSYIQQCNERLKPQGLMAIQAITIVDQRYQYYRNNVDFIQKYIFPGGFLPSITVLAETATRYSDLVIRDLFDLGLDYAQTLADWRQRFEISLEQVRALGYDERFVRMWRYYLCYCEGGFNARTISAVHMTLQKSG